jgi:hypothetical protein
MHETSDFPEFCCESQDNRVLTIDSCHSLVRIRKMASHSKPFFMFDALLTVIFRIARYVNMFISDVWFIVVQCLLVKMYIIGYDLSCFNPTDAETCSRTSLIPNFICISCISDVSCRTKSETLNMSS